jgi:iron complex outermembrane recepter protein
MPSRDVPYRWLLSASAFAVALTGEANAQTVRAPAYGPGSAAEIVVTARKREERLQETPIAITAVTAAQLDARGAVDLTDVGPLAPNVIVRTGGLTSGSSSAALVSIRGIGQSDFTINTDPAVGIYLDGVYLGRSLGSLLDLIDVERVEVLRGPQGVLFGRNTVGGAISLVSRAPAPGELSATVSGAGGERGFRQPAVRST